MILIEWSQKAPFLQLWYEKVRGACPGLSAYLIIFLIIYFTNWLLARPGCVWSWWGCTDLQERRKCPSSLSSVLALSNLFSGNWMQIMVLRHSLWKPFLPFSPVFWVIPLAYGEFYVSCLLITEVGDFTHYSLSWALSFQVYPNSPVILVKWGFK